MKDVQNRVTWLLALLAIGLLLVTFQLYHLTVIQEGTWTVQAEENKLRVLSTQGPRGAIYDQKGRSLATSEPAFAAVLIDQNLEAVDRFLPKLSLLLTGGDVQRAMEMAERVRRRAVENKENWRQYEPVFIARKLDPNVVSALMERREEFPGVVLVTESARNYPAGSLAGSLLGYVGVVSSDQIKLPAFTGYQGDEIVGKDGIELYYERELQGKPGKRSVIVDLLGRPLGDSEETPPTPGHNLYLTLDMALQRTAEQALRTQMEWISQQNDKEANPIRAAMVVQDVRTGAIRASASIPAFDPNVFAGEISDTQWQELISDPAKPLQNWAIAGYAPGSIYKMSVGLAALELKEVGPYERIDCPTNYWLYHKPKNWTPYPQGPADIARALAISCDPYFYELGHRLGIDPMAGFLERFGFGRLTGVDLPGESPGNLPTQKSYGERWVPGQVLSVAIGQGDVLVTPMQLAGYTASIANGGSVYRPFLVDEITTADNQLVQSHSPEITSRLNASPDNLKRIQEGMRLAVTSPEGTAHLPFVGFPVAVAGKTGSAETGHAWSNGFTVAYAPYDKPEIAVSIVIEGGAHGSWVAPAARAVMAAYFGVAEEHVPSRAIKAD